jgi:hypothetical protein
MFMQSESKFTDYACRHMDNRAVCVYIKHLKRGGVIIWKNISMLNFTAY